MAEAPFQRVLPGVGRVSRPRCLRGPAHGGHRQGLRERARGDLAAEHAFIHFVGDRGWKDASPSSGSLWREIQVLYRWPFRNQPVLGSCRARARPWHALPSAAFGGHQAPSVRRAGFCGKVGTVGPLCSRFRSSSEDAGPAWTASPVSEGRAWVSSEWALSPQGPALSPHRLASRPLTSGPDGGGSQGRALHSLGKAAWGTGGRVAESGDLGSGPGNVTLPERTSEETGASCWACGVAWVREAQAGTPWGRPGET